MKHHTGVGWKGDRNEGSSSALMQHGRWVGAGRCQPGHRQAGPESRGPGPDPTAPQPTRVWSWAREPYQPLTAALLCPEQAGTLRTTGQAGPVREAVPRRRRLSQGTCPPGRVCSYDEACWQSKVKSRLLGQPGAQFSVQGDIGLWCLYYFPSTAITSDHSLAGWLQSSNPSQPGRWRCETEVWRGCFLPGLSAALVQSAVRGALGL